MPFFEKRHRTGHLPYIRVPTSENPCRPPLSGIGGGGSPASEDQKGGIPLKGDSEDYPYQPDYCQ